MTRITGRKNDGNGLGNWGVVVIQVRPGETNEAAWERYLQENPETPGGMTRIFNHGNGIEAGKHEAAPAGGPVSGSIRKPGCRGV